MKKFYVASGFKNIDTVRYVSNQLIKKATFKHMIGQKMIGL
jgi:hypothetical protein